MKKFWKKATLVQKIGIGLLSLFGGYVFVSIFSFQALFTLISIAWFALRVRKEKLTPAQLGMTIVLFVIFVLTFCIASIPYGPLGISLFNTLSTSSVYGAVLKVPVFGFLLKSVMTSSLTAGLICAFTTTVQVLAFSKNSSKDLKDSLLGLAFFCYLADLCFSSAAFPFLIKDEMLHSIFDVVVNYRDGLSYSWDMIPMFLTIPNTIAVEAVCLVLANIYFAMRKESVTAHQPITTEYYAKIPRTHDNRLGRARARKW